MADGFKLEVDGSKELRRAIRKAEAKDLQKALRAANKESAGIVADEAKDNTPVLTGALKKSVRATGTLAKGEVAVGRARSNNYARIVHFGWASRGIKPNPFVYDALGDKAKEVRDTYAKQVEKITRDLSTRSR